MADRADLKIEPSTIRDVKSHMVDQGDLAPMEGKSPLPLPAPGNDDSAREPQGLNSPFEKKQRSFVSLGERVHNEVTYRGVDWLLNATFGVAFAFWAARTPKGRAIFSEPVSKGFNWLLKPVIKNTHNREPWVRGGVDFVSIMFGGTVTIPPIMWLENNKTKVVNFFDKLIYGKDKVETDPKFEQAYREIDKEPRKDFGAGMLTRFISLAIPLALTMNPKSDKFLHTHVYDHIAKFTRVTAEKIGIRPQKWIHNFQPNRAGEMVSDWQHLHNMIGFDFGLTVLYSVLHEITYKAVAKMQGKGKHHAMPERPPAPPATAIEVTPPPASTLRTDQLERSDETPRSKVSAATRDDVIAGRSTPAAEMASAGI